MFSQNAAVPFRRGISGSSLRAGVLLPPRDVLPDAAGAVAALIGAWTDELNAQGGVKQRRLDLFFDAPGGTPRERAEALRAFVSRERLFALVASFTDGADLELSEAAAEIEVPLLATISSNPASSIALNRWLFDLCGGMAEQSLALVTAFRRGTIAVVCEAGATADAVQRRARGAGIAMRGIDAATATAAAIHTENPSALLFSVSAAVAERLLLQMRAMNWWPPLLLPGGAVPPQFIDRLQPRSEIWIAMPSAPDDRSAEALDGWNELARRHRLPAGHQLSQFAALTSLRLFVDAFQRAAEVSREGFLAALDATSGFHSGLFPPLTYGPQRHIGAGGAWVFALHEKTPPRWVEVDVTSPARV